MNETGALAPITMLTDFGRQEPYVGVMEGVIAGLCPGATVVHLTHEIAPQDIAAAAFWLANSQRYFPPGTIHVAVVDPGVGTSRHGVALRALGQTFIAPDNGLLAPIVAQASAAEVRLLNGPRVGLAERSNTFHGRDVFAPAAAQLLGGHLRFEELGDGFEAARLHPLETPSAPGQTSPQELPQHAGPAGRIRWQDRYGNLLTDLPPPASDGRPWVLAAPGVRAPFVRTYGEAPPYALVAVVGGFGVAEFAVRNGSAAALTALPIGAPVWIEPAS